MKKKLLLLTVLVAILACTFALSISASEEPAIDVPAYDRTFTVESVAYPLWEADENGDYHPLFWYNNGTELVSVRADNTDSTKAPYVTYSVYTDSTVREVAGITITDADAKTYDGKATIVIANLNNIYLKAGDTKGISHIKQGAFKGSTVLKAVFLPASITYMQYNNGNHCSFENCTALEYVEFPSNAVIETIGCNVFQNCTALKAISLPENLKKIDYVSFSGCTSLQAIYLPDSLTEFGNNGWNKGAFFSCTNAYFVDEPFTLNSTLSNMPAKPDIYYFPAGLTEIGECIRGCSSMNNTIVFGNQITSHSTTMYYGIGSSTVVYLGNMTSFSHTEKLAKEIKFLMPNTTQDLATVTTGAKAYENSALYLCSIGRKCALGYSSVTWSDETLHIYEVEKNTPPTCTEPGVKGYACFCGLASTEAKEIPATGHTASETIIEKYFTKNEDGSINYFANMIKLCPCSVCTENAEFEMDNTALFATDKGYSFSETDASSISYTLHVNVDAIKAYLLENTGFKYGIVVSANTNNAPISLVDGAVTKAEQTAVVELQGTTHVYEYVMAKLTLAENYQASELFCQAYVAEDTNITYLGHDSVSINAEVISHAILVEKYESKEDLEKVA